MVNFESVQKNIKELDKPQIEKLIDWGLQRQLQWAVVGLTSIVALIQIFLEQIPIILLLVLFGAVVGFQFLAIYQYVLYYWYVAQLEETWFDKEKIDIPSLQKPIFIIQDKIHPFILNCPTNSYLTFWSITILIEAILLLVRIMT